MSSLGEAAETTDTALKPLTYSVCSERSSRQCDLFLLNLGTFLARGGVPAEESVSGFRVVSVISGAFVPARQTKELDDPLRDSRRREPSVVDVKVVVPTRQPTPGVELILIIELEQLLS